MKNTLLFLSLTGSLILPAAMHADPPATKAKRTDKVASHQAAVTKVVTPQHETVYITKQPLTGSHIPTVWREYDGRIDSASSPAVYGEQQLTRAGQLDVASELVLVDPSITLGGRGPR